MNNLDKSGFLYKAMTRFRLKFAIICIIYIVLFAMFTNSCSDYLLTRAFGPSELDTERFSGEVGSMMLMPDYSYDETSPDARIFGYASPDKSYLQDGNYRFDVKIEDVTPADFAYTIGGVRVTPDTDTEEDPVAIKVDYATIGGKKVILLIPSNQDVLPGDNVTGIFTQPSPIILAELAKDLGEDGVELILKFRHGRPSSASRASAPRRRPAGDSAPAALRPYRPERPDLPHFAERPDPAAGALPEVPGPRADGASGPDRIGKNHCFFETFDCLLFAGLI